MRILGLSTYWSLSSPPANSIAVLLSGGDWLKELVLKDLGVTTLGLYQSSRGIQLTPVLIARALLRLRFIDWFTIGKRHFLRDLSRQIYAQYVLACLDEIRAKVVLTFIDNSHFFQYLSRIDKQRTYFAIQNGTRTLYCVRDSLPPPPHLHSTISMTNFVCFGQRDVELFRKNGHKIDSYFPVGSLIGGYYKSTVSRSIEAPTSDLCLISQWSASFFAESAVEAGPASTAKRWRTALESLNSFLLRLISETGLSLVICPREDLDPAEVSFYERTFAAKAKVLESDRRNFSTYRAIEKSRLAIAINSTTLLEAMSWGQKVLWCNLLDDEQVEMPEAGISYFHGDDYNAFKERVLMLLKMSQEEYENLTRERARYINNFDPANPPHQAIRKAVLDALSGKRIMADTDTYVQR